MNRWTVRLAWILPLASVLTAMAVHHFRGAANAPIIFISQADYPGPESLMFTLGLTVSGVWQGWTVWSMTAREPRPWSLERLVGLLAAFCVVVMANRSMSATSTLTFWLRRASSCLVGFGFGWFNAAAVALVLPKVPHNARWPFGALESDS